MSKDLIAEVAEACAKAAWSVWKPFGTGGSGTEAIAAVLRERFVLKQAWLATCGPLMPCEALVPRPLAPVPTVAEAARARALAAICVAKNVTQTIRDATDELDAGCNRALAALKEEGKR